MIIGAWTGERMKDHVVRLIDGQTVTVSKDQVNPNGIDLTVEMVTEPRGSITIAATSVAFCLTRL